MFFCWLILFFRASFGQRDEVLIRTPCSWFCFCCTLQWKIQFWKHIPELYYWLIMNPVSWPHCCPLTLPAVHGDHLDAPDGHAEVHRWRLQRGPAGGEEALLFPGGQTLHVLLSNLQLPWEGKPGLSANPAHSDTPPAYGVFNTCSPSRVSFRPRRCCPWSSPAGRKSAATSRRCRTRWWPW